jgi:hypothetical protein
VTQQRPSVTVVIPLWNAERWIARAIDSVAAQAQLNVEIIVIDDGSTDRSLEIVKSHRAHVYWETGANEGACAARNRGLALAKSEYVLFLDADDYIESPLLEDLVASAQAASADMAFGPSALEYADGRRRPKAPIAASETAQTLFARIFGDGWVPLHSILWRAAFVREIGGWNESMLRNQDGELLGRALIRQPKLAVSSSGCAVYVQHNDPERISSRQTAAAMACRIAHLARCGCEIAGTEFALAGRPALAAHSYDLARECYFLGYEELGREALALARDLGLRRYRGSGAHRIAANLFGFGLAQAASRWRRRMTAAAT